MYCFGRIRGDFDPKIMYWPERLPLDFDVAMDEPMLFFEEMSAEGQLIYFDNPSTGTLGVYIDEPIPSHIAELTHIPVQRRRIIVRGKTLFGEAAYISRDNPDFLSEYAELDLPEGDYDAEVFQFNFPSSLRRRWICERYGRWKYYFPRILFWSYFFGMFGALSTIVLIAWDGWSVGIPLLAFFVLIIGLAFCAEHTGFSRSAHSAADAFDEAYPANVVRLTRF